MTDDTATERQAADRLLIEGLSKTFPGTRALDDVSIEARRGRVLALLGHNGSGKSTLIKVLAGFHQPDDGARAWVDGQPLALGDPEAAKALGLRFVHQDLGLIPELNAVDNVALTIGYARRGGRIDQGQQIARTERLLERFGVELDVTRPLAETSPVERTCVAIARAMFDWDEGPRVLVLDEPTASLPSREVARLFSVISEVRAAGHAIVYVSHRMEEIFQVADDVVVLRSGQVVGRGPVAEQSPEALATLIAGHAVVQGSRPAPAHTDEDVLRVTGLRGAYLDGVDLRLRRGEVLGIAGLLGSGRDELPYALVGAAAATADAWWIDGSDVPAPTPATAGGLGIGFVPAERGREGLIAEFTVRENLTLGALPTLRSGASRSIFGRSERRAAERWLAEVGVDGSVADSPVSTLSGGNQQRVLFGRCLNTEPVVLVLAEPTAGVDVGARESLYGLLRERVEGQGLSIVLASSDTEDLVSMCDRVLVMREGRVVDEMRGDEVDAERIVSVMESVR